MKNILLICFAFSLSSFGILNIYPAYGNSIQNESTSNFLFNFNKPHYWINKKSVVFANYPSTYSIHLPAEDANNFDTFLSPRTALFGGSQDHDDIFVKIVGSPYSSGDAGASLLSIFDTDGPEGWGRNGFGNDDGGDLSMVVNPVSPRFMVGEDISNADSIRRKVILTEDGAQIIPALNQDQLRLYRPWMRVYTNWQNGDTSKGMNNRQVVRPSVYFGYVSNLKNDNGVTIFSVVTDPASRISGWRTANSDEKALQPPGHNKNDMLNFQSKYEPLWPYLHTVLFFGMANKKFGYNIVVACGKQDILGEADNSVTRECQAGEVDLRNVGNVDFKYEVQGPAISYSGKARATSNSYNLALAGSNETMLEIEGQWWSTAIKSSPIYVPGYDGPSNQAGAVKPYITMGMSTAEGWGANTMLTYPWISYAIWNKRNTLTNGIGSYSDFTTNMGVLIDNNNGKITGVEQEHIELNPASNHNGIGLCGYGQADRSCNLIVNNDTVIVKNGIADGSFTFNALPKSHLLDGQHVWCSDCKLNGVKGVEVFWHSINSEWTDILNNSAKN